MPIRFSGDDSGLQNPQPARHGTSPSTGLLQNKKTLCVLRCIGFSVPGRGH
jgi:hypothetical protein